MTLMRTSENKDNGFNLYFLVIQVAKAFLPSRRTGSTCRGSRRTSELTWNYGTGTLDSNHVLRMDTDSCNLEKDESFKYHDGNSEPQGFGHICKQTLF
jgi:lactoylglutathione lyase